MTLLRRFALTALAILFVASTLWGRSPQPEIRTGIWRGQRVTYQWFPGKNGKGRAIYQGDILLDNVQQSPNGPHANSQGIAFNQYLWPKVNGVAQVPYYIEPTSGDQTNITNAIGNFNIIFAGVIQFVQRNGQAGYVDFYLDPSGNNGECEADEGYTGTEQFATGAGGTSNPCTEATVEHEMGHIVGLWHEQARDDRNTYLDVNYNAIIKASRSNFDIPYDSEGVQDLTPFDYASVMEYPPFSFSRNGEPCIETIPAGIPLSNPNGYSAGDIDGVLRLYGATPTLVTVTSNPPGLQVMVDGSTITTPQTFSWTLNSTHTLGVASGAQTLTANGNSVSYTYGRWNDSTTQDHTITVAPGNNLLAQPATSPAVTVYSANFIQLVPYTNVISPVGAGTVTPSPAPLTYSGITGEYYTIRQLVTLTAAPQPGQNFLSFINSPYYLPGGIGANPKPFYAMYDGSAINLTTYFTSSPVSTVTTNPVEANLGVTVDNDFWYAPVNFAWTPASSHSIGIASPIYPLSSNTYFTFSNWSDSGLQSHSVIAQSVNTTYTADITGNYLVDAYMVETGVNGTPCAGTLSVTPASTENGYYPAGTVVNFAETPTSPFVFTGWLYDLSGLASSQNITVDDEVLVAADYNVNSTPLAITSLSPASTAAGGPAFTLTINGAGFSSSTLGYVNGTYRAIKFVSSTQVTMSIMVSDLAAAGAFQVAVGNYPVMGCGAYVPATFFVSIGSGSGTPVVKLIPPSLAFASVAVGTTSGSKPVTLSNTGTGALPISSIVASGDFTIASTTCSSSLAKGASCAVNVTFNPSVAAAITGALTFSDGATPGTQIVKLTGTGVAPLTFSPTSLTLPSVAVGSTSSATLMVTNKQATAISLSPAASSYYSVTGGTCGASLAGGAGCTIIVTFTPEYKGSVKGALAITTNGAFSPLIVGLTGTATGGATVPLTISPASLTYTSTGIGATAAAKVVTVTNKSTGTVTIGSITASADYAAVASGTTPCTSGLALAKSAKCTFSVTFTPTDTGSLKGEVSIASTGGAVSPQIVGLTGTGALPVVVSPTSIAFMPTAVGTTSAATTVTLTNNSGTTLNISNITASGDFAAAASGTSPCGATVAAGATCTFSVTFTPTVKAAITGAATVTESAPTGPVVLKLTGTGS